MDIPSRSKLLLLNLSTMPRHHLLKLNSHPPPNNRGMQLILLLPQVIHASPRGPHLNSQVPMLRTRPRLRTHASLLALPRLQLLGPGPHLLILLEFPNPLNRTEIIMAVASHNILLSHPTHPRTTASRSNTPRTPLIPRSRRMASNLNTEPRHQVPQQLPRRKAS